NFRFFQEDLCDLCKRARNINVVDVMRPVTESIDENASLSEAIHKMVMWSTLSVLVTRGNDVVGLLRLSDVFQAVADYMKNECDF
ncbi:MAG: CBS domain-containing protein, partial [Candidatus Zixiibacteriota bacterium]